MEQGDLLDDRFEIVAKAGSGAMGAVFRSIDRATGARVAVKVLKGGHAERFAREVQVLAELSDPAIVGYVAHGSTRSGEPYLVMEWLEGEDLAKRLDRAPLTAAETILLVRRVASGLAVAHDRGVVHRDLKPSNIFLERGELARARLLDFGIASTSRGARLTREGALLGTPSYMSPEQARGSRVSPQSDVFSVGCLLFRSLTGRAPFAARDLRTTLARIVLEEAPRVRDLVPTVPFALDALVAMTLAKETDQRPKNGRALLQLAMQLTLEDASPSHGVSAVAEGARHLGEREQRLVTILVASMPAFASAISSEGLLAIASRFGGRLERLRDGSILIVSSGTSNLADQAVLAARCALALRAELPTAAIALACGRATVAEQATVGEVIERAMRILGDDERNGPTLRDGVPEQPGELLKVRLDSDTAELLEGRFDIAREGLAFFLRDPRGPLEAPRRLLGRETPCVGRAREAAMLDAVLDGCVQEPQARGVLLLGEPGAGKSRLCHELIRRAAGRLNALEILVAQGDPVGAGSAFGMATQIVRRAAWLSDLDPVDRKRAKLLARFSRHVAAEDVHRVTRFLGELVGAGLPGDDDVQLRAARNDPRLMGDQIRAAFETWIRAEAAAKPMLIVLEDVHWGDAPSLQLVEMLVRHLSDLPLMVLAVSRPDPNAAIFSLETTQGFTSVALAPIRPRAAEELVRDVLGAELPQEKLDWVIREARGNALHLEELIRVVVTGKELIPGTVLGSVQARLDALDGPSRRVLRAASVFGQVARLNGVATLLGDAMTGELPTVVHGLVEAEVLTTLPGVSPDELLLVFRHALVREASYAMLTEEDRTLGHKLAGEWLERAGERDAMVLAEHFERGGELLRASSAFERAARQALEGGDLRAAVDRAERGLRCGATGMASAKLLGIAADAHRWLGDNELLMQRAQEAQKLATTGSPTWWSAVELVALACTRLGERARILALADELERLDDRSMPEERLRIESTVTRMLLVLGHCDRAHRFWEGAVARGPRDYQDLRLSAFVDTMMVVRGKFAGEEAKSLRHALRALGSYESMGDLRNAAITRCNIGNLYNNLGCFEIAEQVLRATIPLAERLGQVGLVAHTHNNLGWALAQCGRLDEGIRALDLALEVLSRQGDDRMAGGALAHLALVHLGTGKLDRAEECAREAVRKLRVAPALGTKGTAALSLVLTARGFAKEALDTAREAMRLVESTDGTEEAHALPPLAHAEALYLNGDHAGARRVIIDARARLLARAALFEQPELEEPFLRRVPEHARTLELAARWE